MSNVPLPCDYEDDWREYKKLFILLSHLRSINELHLLISSHTREDSPPGPIYNTLKALKGLLAYLTGYCSPEEQESFMKGILGLIARSAAMLEERVPSTGIPFLESQESNHSAEIVSSIVGSHNSCKPGKRTCLITIFVTMLDNEL